MAITILAYQKIVQHPLSVENRDALEHDAGSLVELLSSSGWSVIHQKRREGIGAYSSVYTSPKGDLVHLLRESQLGSHEWRML